MRKTLLVLAVLLVSPAVVMADGYWDRFGLWFHHTLGGDSYALADMPAVEFIAGVDNTGASPVPLPLEIGDGLAVDGSDLEVDWDAEPHPTTSSNTHSLGTCFQVSATKPSRVSYSISISGVASLGTTSVHLESFSDSGCTTGTVEIERIGTGGVAVAPTMIAPVRGDVPAGRYLKLRSSGASATIAVVAGQETVE